MRMLTPCDAAEIVGLYAGIAEFAENYAGKEEAQTENLRLGLASRLVASLCTQCLGTGMHTLCLFFDNPLAGAIYRKIGFQESGSYMLVM